MSKLVFLVLLISAVLSLRNPTTSELQKPFDSSSSSSSSSKNPRISFASSSGTSDFRRIGVLSLDEIDEILRLQYNYYAKTCPQAEEVVSSTMAGIFYQRRDTPPALLRLLFHDCFIRGCDASVLLNHSNNNYLTEQEAIPNQTLRGFDVINKIKEELEKACPGVVSCADILALATRDGVLLAGGPFYPVFTGRRDSTESFYNEAMAEIPRPDDNITRILNLFSSRGFSDRETVALLGGHNIGKIGCQFILARVNNFKGTGQPDLTMDSDFLNQMRSNCEEAGNSINAGSDNRFPVSMAEITLDEMPYDEELATSIESGGTFDSQYYQSLLRGRGLLFADQQLMAEQTTRDLVTAYASDEGSTFRRDFAKVMIKMSSLGILTGSQGQVRVKCSMSLTSG